MVLTVNGKADAVLIDAKTYEKHLSASNMAKLLAPAEADVHAGRTRPLRSFLREFKIAHKNTALKSRRPQKSMGKLEPDRHGFSVEQHVRDETKEKIGTSMPLRCPAILRMPLEPNTFI